MNDMPNDNVEFSEVTPTQTPITSSVESSNENMPNAVNNAYTYTSQVPSFESPTTAAEAVIPQNIFKIQVPEGTPGFAAGANTGFREVAGVTTLIQKPDQQQFRSEKNDSANFVGQQAETSVRRYGADVAQQRNEKIDNTVEKITNAVEAVGNFFKKIENLKQRARNVDAVVTGFAFKVGAKAPSAIGEAVGVTGALGTGAAALSVGAAMVPVAIGVGAAAAAVVVPAAVGFGAYSLGKKAIIETYKFADKSVKWVGEKAPIIARAVGHVVAEAAKGVAAGVTKGAKTVGRELEYGYIANSVAVNVINAADNVTHKILLDIVNGMERKASKNTNTGKEGETAVASFLRETFVKEGLLAAKTDVLKAKTDAVERNKERRMALQRLGKYVLTGKWVGKVQTSAFSAAPSYDTVSSNVNTNAAPLI
ncbi:MAG: hypothetical protein UR96_C0007G0003 [candidate division WS6 bacterium GW2011_GWC1_36_11]|uniref:Uncharacterized protein n=2 Tax=Candidatus Dojkabacteria TaxID=74243 RepID=A0A0G0DEG8_9BACT|nr:MAG: hypothetical protein UR96_C0007G0003 [candidate division WS6 bacterium GW2011_GWC1_36_11]KKQ15532.1 MAG: hypothetical protein US29_C0042G0010 [candidate division WS6 bacterium GW2011_GWF1_36_8]HAM37557.1 hypothetical protein [Patescibacteria group bacterium]HAM96530.1 hypothetical protein [Patescibacteria group bacterium]